MQSLPIKVLLGALTLGLGFTILFSHASGLGINVFLFECLLIGVSYALSQIAKKPFPLYAWISALFAIAFAATFAIWTSSYGLGLSMFGLIVSNIFFALFLLGHHGRFPHPFYVIIDTFHHVGIRTLSRYDILGKISIPQLSLSGNAVLRGAFFAVPILLIFLALFISADLVLQDASERFIENLADSEVIARRIQEIVLTAFIFAVVLPILASAFWREIAIRPLLHREPSYATEISVMLGLVNALFAAFILFQAYYLFGGAAAFASIEGITYAEYARQGFGELAASAALVFLLILTVRHFHMEKTSKTVKILEITLLIQTAILLASAWQRLSLYVAEYGFTPARLFGFWFFALVILLLALFALHLAKEDVQEKFIRQALVTCGIAILAFTALAPDALAMRLNIARAQKTGEAVETSSLVSELSAEAYPTMMYIYSTLPHDEETNIAPLSSTAMDARKANIKNDFTRRWNDRICTRIDSEGRKVSGSSGKGVYTYEDRFGWREWNLSRTQLPRCNK